MLPTHALELADATLKPWWLFGWLPVATALLTLTRAGIRRGWPWRAALLATAALVAGMALGASLLHSVLGASGGGVVGWLLAQRALRLARPPLAALAFALLATLAVGRIGCLLGGCCFGTLTDLPWALRYGEGSPAWLLHRAMHLVPASGTPSLGVHPYPAYESLGLVLGLLLLHRLRPHLRSEGALLAFAAAWDLGLRAIIDGRRAMVNVAWALEPGALGLDRARLTFALAAALAALAGLAIEGRARRAPSPPRPRPREPAPIVLWGAFAALVAVGLATDATDTTFLHGALLLALAAVAVALPLPWSFDQWSRGHTPRLRVAVRAAAVGALVPLALSLGRAEAEHPGGAARTPADPRGSVYEVDPTRERVVRVGRETDAPEALAARRAALGLPDELGSRAATTATAAAGAEAARSGGEVELLRPLRLTRPRLWLGGAAAGSSLHYVQHDGCSGTSRTWDRTGGGGWLQVEGELPATELSRFWVGGRVGTYHELLSVDTKRGPEALYYLQAWGEWEHPNLTVGLGGAVGLRRSSYDGVGAEPVAFPGARLRLGFEAIGVEAGVGDRGGRLGPIGGHLGLSGRLFAGEDGAPRLRYAVALETFGGARPSTRQLGTATLEYHLDARRRFELSFSAGEGVAGTIGYAATLGE